MTRDDEVKVPRLFDVRIVERNIRKGLTTRKDYDKWLKSLPDVAEKAAPPDMLASSADDDDEDLDDMDDDIDDEDDLDDEVVAEPSEPGSSNGAPSA